MEALGVRHCPRPPVHWFGHPAVGPNELAVLMVLLAHSSPDGTCFPSQGRIAGLLKRSRPWANAVIARLVEAGLIASVQRSLGKGGATSCLYRITGVERAGQDEDRPSHDTPCRPADTNTSHTDNMEDSLTSARERAGEDAIQFQDRQGGAGRQSALPADIPADWVPTAADVAWARSRCPNLDILAFTENFVLACCAKGYRYADASAAWRKWLVEPKGRLPTIELRPGASRLHPHTGAGQGRGGPPLAERNAAIAQACLDRINARRGL